MTEQTVADHRGYLESLLDRIQAVERELTDALAVEGSKETNFKRSWDEQIPKVYRMWRSGDDAYVVMLLSADGTLQSVVGIPCHGEKITEQPTFSTEYAARAWVARNVHPDWEMAIVKLVSRSLSVKE